MDIFTILACILISGLIFGRLVELLKLPTVTGYLIAGIIIGPSVLTLISSDNIGSLEAFSTTALSFISFIIGSELRLNYLKKLGIKPIVIATVTSIFTYVAVTIALLLVRMDLSSSLILAAIATSTAPPAIMLIVKQYKAKGEFTNMMLSVVAIDDILSILMFGFTLVVVKNLNTDTVNVLSWLVPFKEIILSLLTGTLCGVILGSLSKIIKSDSAIMTLIIIFIFISNSISNYFDISSLLVCSLMGMFFVNLFKPRITDKVLFITDYITPPILIIFFVLAGATLDFQLINKIGIIGVVYILARVFGKVVGSTISSILAKASKNVIKYLGPTLLSQTGLAIGFSLMIVDLVPNGERIQAIVIASSFIIDLFGPLLVRSMLIKTEDISIRKKSKG